MGRKQHLRRHCVRKYAPQPGGLRLDPHHRQTLKAGGHDEEIHHLVPVGHIALQPGKQDMICDTQFLRLCTDSLLQPAGTNEHQHRPGLQLQKGGKDFQ